MKTARDFWNSQVPTDANKTYVSDYWATRFTQSDLFSFAEAYHKSKMAEITNENIEASLMIRGEMADYVAGYIAGAKAIRDGKIRSTN